MLCSACLVLSRLYYSFANAQIHSKKGYSTSVFTIIIIIGTAILITFPISLLQYPGVASLCIQCGIDSQLQFHFVPVKLFPIDSSVFPLINIAVIFGFLWWDFSIFSLYFCKIYCCNNNVIEKKNANFKRIGTIMDRMLVLTFFHELISVYFYLLPVLIDCTTNVSIWMFNLINSVGFVSASVSIEISMFWMMDHNTSEYVEWVKCIDTANLGCCCSFVTDIKEHLLDMDDIYDLKVSEKPTNTDTTYVDTQDHPLPSTPDRIAIETSEVTVTIGG